jgi:hypothetical protein
MAQFGRSKDSTPAAEVDVPPPAAPAAEVAVKQDNAPAPISAEVAQRVRDAVEGIPGDDGSGAERIITALLDAKTIDDLNAPWDGTSGRNLNGRRLTIRGISQRSSQFADGAGIFLVADAVDSKTGEQTTFTTSAISVVIQLARAWQLGLFPIIADIVVAERPTEAGFYPYHLKVIAAGNAGRADGH